MGDLSVALNNALTGLNVNKQALGVLSGNIANANTPGYTRKVVDLSNNIVDGTGAGVKVDEISRKVDEYLARALQRQNSTFTKLDTQNDYAQRLQVLLGKPGGSNTVDTSITNFFNVLQSLASSPEKGSLRLNSINTGVALAQQISGLAKDMEGLRFQADQDISAAVKRDNSILQQLYDNNQAINTAFNSGRGTADLLDKRDNLLQQLSGDMDISYFIGRTGQVNVTTNTGIGLLDSTLYQLSYTPQSSAEGFINDTNLAAVQVFNVDSSGNPIGTPQDIVTGGTSDQVTTSMLNGKIRGLLDLRDQKIPQLLEQLDMLASNLRDQFNAIHNAGSSYPGAFSLTGTRAVTSTDSSQWQGSVRIALLDSHGQPAPSVYSDETGGFRPLTMDLGSLDSGLGAGKPTVQGIIDEINQHFNMPQNKAELGDINNIRLASDSVSLSSTNPFLKFDFDLENIAANPADFYLTGVQVLDDTNADITSYTSTVPSIDLDPVNTYTTVAGVNSVTITTTTPHGLQNGDVIYLSDPGAPVDGIPQNEISGFVTVSNVTANGFDITTVTTAGAGGTFGVAGQTATPKYATAGAGLVSRTKDDGTVTLDLNGNPNSQFYTVKATVGVRNSDGTISQGTVQYRIVNSVTNILNKRYAAEAVAGSAALFTPNQNAPMLKATLVDANGKELAKVGGAYVNSEQGYLKISAQDPTQVVAIDSLSSEQLGLGTNSDPGTNRGFSYYFEMNNFFNHNVPTNAGDTLHNSAVNLSVQSRLLSDPDLISLGTLTRSLQPADPTQPPLYTYERASGDNSTIQALAGLGTTGVTFQAAGGLGVINTDFNGYAGQVLGFVGADASNTQNQRDSQKVIMDGFNERFSSVSGVNLDEELANTIIFQNAYTASARVITVASRLFDVLLNAFQ